MMSTLLRIGILTNLFYFSFFQSFANECNSAISVACGTQESGSTIGGTSTGQGTCVTSEGTGGANWYTFVGDGSTWTFDITANSFDTKIWVFSGSCGSLTCVTGDDDGGSSSPGSNESMVSFVTTIGVTYYVAVGGYNVNEGTYTVDIAATSCIPPGPMTYSSSNVTQASTSDVLQLETNREVIKIEIVTQNYLTPLNLTQLNLGTDGTTSWATDLVGNMNVYYTGNSNTFSTANLFGGSAPLAPGGSVLVNGVQQLNPGVNYFWVTVDISPTAIIGNVVDAICSQITLSGGVGNQVPSNTNPAGTRPITNNLSMQSGTNSYTTCNMNFYDDAGVASDYSSSFNGTTTFYPASAGCNQIQMVFNTFATELNFDFLSIYDGNSTSAPLIGTYDGGTSPGTVTSTAVDGSLTIRFTSDGGTVGVGWDAAISCVVPANMTYASSTVSQPNTSTVQNCYSDQEILRLEVVTNGVCSPLSLEQIQLNLIGTTLLTDLTNVDVFYTAGSSVFSNSVFIGNVAPAGGSLLVNCNQQLVSGVNYFWVAFDINAGATPGNVLDAQVTQLTISSNNSVPTTPAPAGNRPIVSCTVGPGGVSSGLSAWFKPTGMYSDLGVTSAVNGVNIEQWNDVSGNGNHITQTTVGDKPVFNQSGPENNFNAYGVSDGTDFMERSTLLGSSSSGSVFFAGRNITLGGQQTAVGFGEFPDIGILSNDGDDPHIGIAGNNMYAWHDRGNVADGSETHLLASYSVNTDQTYTYNQKWTNGMNGTTMRQDAIEEHASNVNIRAGSLGTIFSVFGAPGGVLEFWEGRIPEVIVYDVNQSSTESHRVESYLALKYGVTLKLNGTSFNYINSGGTVLWEQASNLGYAFDIAGIVRDDASVLSQLKSHSTNTLTGNYRDIVTIANGTNFGAPPIFADNNSSLIWGHNDGLTINTGALVNYPTDNGEVIETIFQREWKSQETGTVGTVTLEFDMNLFPGAGGIVANNDLANLRLLVDEDGDYSDGFSTSIAPSSFNNVTNVAYFEHDFTPPSGPESTQLKGFFFTLGSTDFLATPLPVELTSFDVENVGCSNIISWSTASENNSDYFILQRSYDALNWSDVGQVKAAGNSQSNLDYTYRDDNLNNNGITYYRLVQVDFNGDRHYYSPITINVFCDENVEPVIYPNPTQNVVYIKSSMDGEVVILDLNGRELINQPILKGESILQFESIAAGTYIATIKLENGKSFSQKIVKQ